MTRSESIGAARSSGQVRLAPEACRRRREALGLSAYQLAQRAGLQELTVVRFEAALVQPRPVTVVALCNALSRLETDRRQAPHREIAKRSVPTQAARASRQAEDPGDR